MRFGDVMVNVNATGRGLAATGIDRFIGLEHLEPGSLHIRSWGNVADGTTFTRRCRPGQVLFVKRRACRHKVAVGEFHAVVSGEFTGWDCTRQPIFKNAHSLSVYMYFSGNPWTSL